MYFKDCSAAIRLCSTSIFGPDYDLTPVIENPVTTRLIASVNRTYTVRNRLARP